MTTDPATGMPELPEGQWWEVRNDGYYNGYYLGVIHNVVVPEKTKPGKHWWNAPVVVPEHVAAKCIRSEYIRDDNVVMARELTAAKVLKTAQRMQRAERKREETRALLGKYPPKKLGAS